MGQKKKILLSFVPFLLFIATGKAISEEISNIPLYTVTQERKTLYQELMILKQRELLIVNFTSSTCIPCKEEVPRLVSFVENWNSSDKRGIKLVLWIVFLEDTLDSAVGTAATLKVSNRAEILYDTLNTSMKHLRFQGTPTSYVLDKNKKILFKGSGYTEENWQRMILAIEQNGR
ncbi:redoxin [Leptospira broomii serovar Hurstbridge str. 5399]|uniref:Redoxin n=1 Tax=Leptospira broomii serovar Hurstbridge str. 5399 TaxID=1049789 RepID=T0F4X4_9LEPT|nr:thioredoxin-like domain-containing protein [Leptospira broomii]EQA46140.1 redoxin [Leptospira broomii serovar Hurstbridge str. 5399]